MCRQVEIRTTITTLLLVATFATMFVDLGEANPYIRDAKIEGTIPPPEGTKPPVISIVSPANHTSYQSNNFQLNFTATIEKSNNISLSISEIYYVASWQKDRTDVDLLSLFVKNNYTWPSEFSIDMTNVPEGPRLLEVYAVATGFAYETRQEIKGIYYTTYYIGYKITSSLTVEFTVDTVSPSILTISVANKTCAASVVLLTLITSEPVSQTSYSLDGQANMTFAGNTTLADLSVGEHNLTVYAWDGAGNVGSSEPVKFAVAETETFPTELVAAAPVAAVAVAGAGLLVYSKKRRQE